MNYFSYAYLPLFLGGTLVLYYLLPLKKRWAVLLAASCLFYLFSAGKLILFIAATAVSIYYAAIWLDKINESAAVSKRYLPKEEKSAFKKTLVWQKKAVVAVAVLFNFGILALLKYYAFSAENINFLASHLHMGFSLPVWRTALPLGISFYTLQAVSYVVDVYRGKHPADRHFGRVALFLCFFPQIVEGPIGRYEHLSKQLYEGRRFDYTNFTFGLQLILWGLFKKIVIADRADMLVKTVFNNVLDYSGIPVIVAVVTYTLQIYAEFSGCMDVVTGSAQLFGVQLFKNFERPFFSKSVNEFWRRWHITLGAWLRDYIFYPVSLSRPFMKLNQHAAGKQRSHMAKLMPAAGALFCVWLGNGIWHGASWKYIAYGMYYYALMMLGMAFDPVSRKVLGFLHIRREGKGYRLFQILRTVLLVNLGMLIFRADGLMAAFHMFCSIFSGFSTASFTDGSLLKLGIDMKDYMVLGAGSLILFAVGLLQEKGLPLRQKIGELPLVIRWPVYLTAIFAVIIFGAYGTGYDPVALIYAKF